MELREALTQSIQVYADAVAADALVAAGHAAWRDDAQTLAELLQRVQLLVAQIPPHQLAHDDPVAWTEAELRSSPRPTTR